LDDWRGEVAAPAAGNHALVFALAPAFAPPLLRLLGDEAGGFQLVAPTRTGKSTAAGVAASVWGSGFAEGWRTTVNSVERTAADHDDLLLVLDEVGLLGRDPRSRADELHEACHQLCAGRGKQRLTVAEPPREWLVLFLSTSELPFRRILAAGGRAAVGGELMRLVDVELPADPSAGIFRDLHGHPTVDRYCAALDHAVARCHDTAGRAYLRRLVRGVQGGRDALVAWLRERVDRYLRRTGAAVGGREAEAVASRFALVYAAGCLAARYKVLPWSRAEILAAVRHCHGHARVGAEAAAPAPAPGPRPPRARRETEAAASGGAAGGGVRGPAPRRLPRPAPLPRWLAAAGAGRARLHPRGAGRRAGAPAAPARFREAVCGGHDQRAVVEALRRHDLIRLHRGGKTTIPRDLPPPLGRTRVVCLKGGILRPAAAEAAPAERRPKRR
jgi:hypothetical protein